jgi:acyl carrier protein
MTIEDVLQQQFPKATIPHEQDLHVGSLPEWDSLSHLNFLLLVEETFGIRFGVEEMSEMKSIHQIRTRLAASGITA